MGRKPIQVEPTNIKMIVVLYENIFSPLEIAKAFGLSREKVVEVLEDQDVYDPPRGKSECIQDFNHKWDSARIAVRRLMGK